LTWAEAEEAAPVVRKWATEVIMSSASIAISANADSNYFASGINRRIETTLIRYGAMK
jgi:hypothetical protein